LEHQEGFESEINIGAYVRSKGVNCYTVVRSSILYALSVL